MPSKQEEAKQQDSTQKMLEQMVLEQIQASARVKRVLDQSACVPRKVRVPKSEWIDCAAGDAHPAWLVTMATLTLDFQHNPKCETRATRPDWAEHQPAERVQSAWAALSLMAAAWWSMQR
jgi:hypothetical protein